MSNKLSMLLFLIIILFALSACGYKPYGHYEDDKMIGIVRHVEPDNNVFEVDISEWHKRDLRGGVDDYGVSITVGNTDDLVIKNEDGTISDINQIKIGQKVLVNPPKNDKGSNYEAKEILLLEMTYKEKYDRLLSRSKARYLTTVFSKEDETLSEDMENVLMGLLSKSPINFGTYPEDYVVDYQKELSIEKYPVMLVFDHKGLVLKTYDVNELVEFLD